MRIENALKEVRNRISHSAIKAGKNPDTIKLVAVSKTVELNRIVEAVESGATILGENKVQEAKDKITNYELRIADSSVEWHFIGNLQKNKAKAAVQLFDLIHSVDTVELAEELNKHAAKENKIQRVLVQAKLSDEITKHGAAEDELMPLIAKVSEMDNLKMEGLMTIPPFFSDTGKSRPYFQRLRQLAEKAVRNGYTINELSMGMSNDFEVAIEEGATIVRVGSAIFGARNY